MAPAAAVAAQSRPGTLPNDSISAKADRGRIRGNSKASLWIVEASDFQCPYCKMWHDSTYAPLVRDYVATGKAQLAYLNFPLSQHQNALPAAEAAMCASVQDKFWPMHDSLFSSQERWEVLQNAMPLFDSTAAHIGVSMPAWRECVSKHLTRPLIEADYERSRTAGVKSTPTFFVGEQLVAGFQPYSFFRQVVEAQLAKSGVRQ
jgi:protein-disulfide isomerase